MNESKTRKSRVVMGLVRVALLLILSLLLVVATSLKASVARADDAMLQLGRHLLALSESGIGAGERAVLINGQELGFRVFTVEQEVSSALDFYEAWCHGEGGDFPGQERALVVLDHSPSGADPDHSYSWKDLVLRHEAEDLGMVACLKHGQKDPTARQLAERLQDFLKTGNLKALGQFHYATATRVGDVTRVVAVWTEGDFFPLTMFPAEGDAPGFDPANLSRPPSGRRMLSAGEFGLEQTLAVYLDLEEDLPTLARFYRLDFIRHGWRLLSDEAPNPESCLLVVQRGNVMRVVSLSREPGEAISVTIASTR